MDQPTENKVTYKQQIKEIISSTEGNSNCADCGILKVSWSSVNHGVFLCLDCAFNHKTYFSSKESTIKSLDMPYWSSSEVDILRIGGNLNFHHFLQYYGIDKYEKDLISKYKNKGVEYYKYFIKAQSEGCDIDQKRPSKEEGVLQIQVQSDPTFIGSEIADNQLKSSKISSELEFNDYPGSNSQTHEEIDASNNTINNLNNPGYESIIHQETTDIATSIVEDLSQYMNEGVKLASKVKDTIKKEIADGTLKDSIKENAFKAKDYIFSEAPKMKNTIISSAKGLFSSLKEKFTSKPPEEPKQENEIITKLSRDYIEANNIEYIELDEDAQDSKMIASTEKTEENVKTSIPYYISSYKEI